MSASLLLTAPAQASEDSRLPSADVFARAADALGRLVDPVLTMLMLSIAVRGEAASELCELLGLRQIDLAMFSQAHHDKLLALRCVRASGSILDRREMGLLLRARLGEMTLLAENAADIERCVRAAEKLPEWVFDPEVAAAQATDKLLECETRAVEAEARKAKARANEAIALLEAAHPEEILGLQVKSGADDDLEEGYYRDREGRVRFDPSYGLPELDFDETVAQTRALLAAIDAEAAAKKEQD